MNQIHVKSSPSLALIKYWGKQDVAKNLPATSSLAIGLDDLKNETSVTFSSTGRDCVIVNGTEMELVRYQDFFEAIRSHFKTKQHFYVESITQFPVAAGLASSSSGFAAMAFGCARLLDPGVTLGEISGLARVGSASAARALYSGFTILKRGSDIAEPLYDSSFWPELRVLVGVVDSGVKPVSSRAAMKLAKETSPYYDQWLIESEDHFQNALKALKKKDLKVLGPLIRQSYLSMFGTMLTSSPPVIYWQPKTLELIHACETLRRDGFNVWETMDAGPQVKVICLESELDQILRRLTEMACGTEWIISKVGGGTC